MMEQKWPGIHGPRKLIKDQFEWDPELPAETFIPEIPADFAPEAENND